MRMVEELTLIDTVTAPDEEGFPTQTTTRRTVWADQMSAKRSEHYQAKASGQRVDIVFAVMADEYLGEAEAEHQGKRYKVERAYQAGLGRVELTCALK